MNRALGAEEDGAVSYGLYRNFLVLLPPDRLASSMDTESAWFEAATMVPIGAPPVVDSLIGHQFLILSLVICVILSLMISV